MSRWSDDDGVPRGAEYDARWQRLAAAGESIHGEADLIASLSPGSVLDAGCGTGRVAIELDRRGVEVVGVDLDPGMLDTARRNAPHITWITGDLVHVEVPAGGDGAVAAVGPRRFDVVALAGNVMIFVAPGTEATVLANMARHLSPNGRVIAGFQLRDGGLTLEDYDEVASAAGLTLEARYATWDAEPYDGGDYAVSISRLG